MEICVDRTTFIFIYLGDTTELLKLGGINNKELVGAPWTTNIFLLCQQPIIFNTIYL